MRKPTLEMKLIMSAMMEGYRELRRRIAYKRIN
jgi:hypothetical protein